MELIFQYMPGFMLVFCRISSFFLVAPIFSARNVPNSFKVGIGFFLSFITFTAMGLETVVFDASFVIAIMRELLIGVLLGFIAYMYFTALQIAGTFIDIQIGFSMANIFDPITGTSSPILGNFKYVLAVLLFLTFNGHHYFGDRGKLSVGPAFK
jgi:flagellar biosynthetic protein FliR